MKSYSVLLYFFVVFKYIEAAGFLGDGTNQRLQGFSVAQRFMMDMPRGENMCFYQYFETNTVLYALVKVKRYHSRIKRLVRQLKLICKLLLPRVHK